MVTSYVDRDVEGGLGDGSSWANAYATLDAWQDAEATDLVAAEEGHTVYYRAASDNPRTSDFAFSGWTTDADYHITLIVPEENRHDGSRGTGTHIYGASVGWGWIFTALPAYTVIDGLHIYQASGEREAFHSALDGIVLVNSLIVNDGTNSGSAGVRGAGGSITIQNTIALSNGGHAIRNTGAVITVLNSTVYTYGNAAAISGSSSSNNTTCVSVYAASTVTDGVGFGQFHVGVTNSYSPDAEYHGTEMSLADAAFNSTTEGEEHLILTADSELINAGQDNSENASWYGSAVDFVGTTRPQGSEWDIGAYEYVASGDALTEGLADSVGVTDSIDTLVSTQFTEYLADTVGTTDTIDPTVGSISFEFVSPTPVADSSVEAGSTVEIAVDGEIISGQLDSFDFSIGTDTIEMYDSSLVLASNFDERAALGESASLVYDISRTGNHGEREGTVTHTSEGRHGGAYAFTGVSNSGRVFFPNDPSIQFTTAFSFSAWVRRDGNFNAWQPIVTKDASNHQYWFGFASGGASVADRLDLVFWNTTGTRFDIYGTTAITDSDWHHVGFAFGDDLIQLYIDGVPEFETPSAWAHTIRTNADVGNDLSIGRTIEWDFVWNGLIDEVRLFNRRLSDAEMFGQMNSVLTKTGSETWEFRYDAGVLDAGSYPISVSASSVEIEQDFGTAPYEFNMPEAAQVADTAGTTDTIDATVTPTSGTDFTEYLADTAGLTDNLSADVVSAIIEASISDNVGVTDSVDTDTVGITHNFTAQNDVVTGPPTVQSATLTQIHHLQAQDVVTAPPTVESATLRENHVLLSQDIVLGAWAVGEPFVAELHYLQAQDVITTPVIVDGATLSQSHILTAQDVTTDLPRVSRARLDPEYVSIHEYNYVVPGAGRRKVSFTFEVTDAGTYMIYFEGVSGVSAVDAAQLIRVDNISDEFLIEEEGATHVGFIGLDNQVVPYEFIINEVGAYVPDTAWVFNYEVNAWSKWRLPMTGFGYDTIQSIFTIGELVGPISEQSWRFDEKLIQEFAPTNLLGQVDGQVYEVRRGVTRDFEAVNPLTYAGYWESKDIDLDHPTIDKTFARVVVYHEMGHSPLMLTVGMSVDQGVTWTEVEMPIDTTRTQSYADFFVTGEQGRFRVRATSPGYFISGFAVKIIPRGEANPY